MAKLNKGEDIKVAPEMVTFRMIVYDEQEEQLVTHIKNLYCRLMPLQHKNLEC
jgi:hypothetical protein